MAHMNSIWRKSGEHKKLPHFTIDRSGKVHKHFDIKYYSMYLDCRIDEQVITVGLENIGQLFSHGGKIYDIYNNLYEEEVYKQNWKNCKIWQPYTEAQELATIELSRYLLEQTRIPKQVTEINVFKKEIDSFEGICYRSNHHIKHYDVNPSWDFKKFKQELENNG